MINNYSHFFFDIDGVVISSTDFYAKLFKEIAEELGADKSIDLNFYRQRVGVKVETWIPYLLPEKNHPLFRPLFEERISEDTLIDNFSIIDGTEELLKLLKEQNKNIAFVSSKRRGGIEAMLDAYNWHQFVDYSVAGNEVEHFKPHPEGTIRALDFFQAKPEETLFIGDSLHDLGAAREAKTDFLGVLTGICTEEDWKRENALYKNSVKDLII